MLNAAQEQFGSNPFQALSGNSSGGQQGSSGETAAPMPNPWGGGGGSSSTTASGGTRQGNFETDKKGFLFFSLFGSSFLPVIKNNASQSVCRMGRIVICFGLPKSFRKRSCEHSIPPPQDHQHHFHLWRRRRRRRRLLCWIDRRQPVLLPRDAVAPPADAGEPADDAEHALRALHTGHVPGEKGKNTIMFAIVSFNFNSQTSFCSNFSLFAVI